jgi:hypothetical protein
LAWKEGLVVELGLDPSHQQFNIFGSRHFEGCFYILPVSPEVLELLPSTHDGTGLLSAILRQRSIEDRNLIVELNGVDSQPFIEVFSLGQLDCKVHVATAEGHLCDLFEVEVFGGLVLLLDGLAACFHYLNQSVVIL